MIWDDVDASVYGSVYHVLARVSTDRHLAAGAQSSIYKAIDALRRHDAPFEHIKLAEDISIYLHRLQVSLRSGSLSDELAARTDLRLALNEWLDTPLRLTLH